MTYEPDPTTVRGALDYAIFALNTYKEPQGSSEDDLARLDEHLAQVIETLVATRDKAPKVQIVHSRDPDSECYLTTFVNDQRIDADVEDIDPGRGYPRADWDERIESWQDDDTAFGAAVREALDAASGSQYIH